MNETESSERHGLDLLPFYVKLTDQRWPHDNPCSSKTPGKVVRGTVGLEVDVDRASHHAASGTAVPELAKRHLRLLSDSSPL
ncbi:hypothetical protein ACFYY5_25950 [Nocardia elegans]|uniref:Uncharacterized protein n=1 Tax=Nocardia elegans TaxID=300029 RepID=A0ABW6TJI7_9NOCA